jgi:hypothetical protein
VIPIGRALLYAKPIYLQAERSPMPQLRLVVLALQEQLGYGPTFEAAMSSLFGAAAEGVQASPPAGAAPPAPGAPATPAGTAPPPESAAVQALIDQAAHDIVEYQRLTAEGKLGEAGQRLESLKKTLEKLKGGR